MNNEILDQTGDAYAPQPGNFSVSGSFKRAFELFKKQWLVLLGSMILFLILVSLAQFVSGFIDYAGWILYTVFSACLYAGFFFLFRQTAQGKELSFSEFFSGFNFIKDIALYQLVYLVLSIIAAIPLLIGVFASFSSAAPAILEWFNDGMNPDEAGMIFNGVSISPLFYLMFALSFVLFLVLGISYTLTTPLIVLNKKGFWEAMELSRKAVWSRFFTFVALIILLTLFNILGLIMVAVGVLFTSCISIGVFYAAYESLFAGLNRNNEAESDALGDV